MPNRHSWLSIFVVLGVALACSVVYAQSPTVPSSAMFRDGTQNTTNPYDSFSYPVVAQAQFVPPGEFCVNPPNSFGTPTPGSSLLAPAQLGGLGVYCDGPLGGLFGNVSRSRDNAVHHLTDLQANGNLLWFQNQLNYNATTVFYPGGFTLSCPTPLSASRTNGREAQAITSVGPGFIYLGETTGCCGACPAPSQGGLYITSQLLNNGGGSGALLLMDYEFLFATVGIHYNSIRLWSIGGNANSGFMSWIGFFQGVVYALEGGGCKTYNDLKDQVLNAEITGNPPSDDPPFWDPESGAPPPGKNDPDIGGLRNSYWKQCVNSEAAFNRGQLGAAGNGLGAMFNHVEAQSGKHLNADSADDLKNCIRSLRGTLGI